VRFKSTLVCLENTLGWKDLANRIVLSEGTEELEPIDSSQRDRNFVIAYTGSSKSQTALDLTLWIAYQTRLVSQQKVFVHVVYAVDRRTNLSTYDLPATQLEYSIFHTKLLEKAGLPIISLGRRKTDAPNTFLSSIEACLTSCETAPSPATQTLLDHADCVLWQARCLAEEWRGSLEAHLRFGNEMEELQRVVEEVNADLLVLGCDSSEHPIVKTLKKQVHCPILGIPVGIEACV